MILGLSQPLEIWSDVVELGCISHYGLWLQEGGAGGGGGGE